MYSYLKKRTQSIKCLFLIFIFCFSVAVSFVSSFFFVCLCFIFVTFHRNERDFILIFHFVYLRDFQQNIPNCYLQFWTAVSSNTVALHTHKHYHANTHAYHSYSFVSNVEFHRYVFFPFLFYFILFVQCYFFSLIAHVFMTNVCHFYFSHIFVHFRPFDFWRKKSIVST